MLDALLPRTDAGVAVQLAAVTVVFAVVAWRLRHRRDVRLLVTGGWLLAYGLIGLRALH